MVSMKVKVWTLNLVKTSDHAFQAHLLNHWKLKEADYVVVVPHQFVNLGMGKLDRYHQSVIIWEIYSIGVLLSEAED